MRANWLKVAVSVAKRQPAAVSEPLLRAIGDALRGEIRAMTNLAWVDAAYYDRMLGAVRLSLGVHKGEEFWRAVMIDSLERPLLKPLRDGAVGIFGRGPASLFRYSRQAWSLVTRDVCDVAYAPAGGFSSRSRSVPGALIPRGRMVYTEVCPEVQLENLALFAVGAARAVIDVVGYEGEVSRGLPGAMRELDVALSWRERDVAASG